MAEFAEENLEQAFPEIERLLSKHWDEVAPYKDLFVLNPDIPTYKAMLDKTCLITARVDGNLVGYIIFIVARHLHYKDVVMATDDIHFLHPDYRKSRTGLGMFVFAEKIIRGKGAKIMTLRCKAAPELNHGAIFERLGYDPQDVVYTKRLDR